MVRLERHHFQVRDMVEARALRRRPQELGSAVIDAGQKTRATRWLQSCYVTEKPDPAEEWIAWLKTPPPTDREVLALLAHPHLVIPQDGNAPWLGINVEFLNPRAALSASISQDYREVLAAARNLQGAELWTLVKSVQPNDRRKYVLETEWWNGRPAKPCTDLNPQDASDLLTVLHDPAPPRSPRTGWVTEPAIIFAWPFEVDQVVAWGDELELEITQRLATSVDLLRILAGE